MMRIAVLGLGNSVLTDDTVGLLVAREVEVRLGGVLDLPAGAAVEVFLNESGGWDVLDYAEGFEALVLVDASADRTLGPGELRWYDGRAFVSPRIGGAHSMDMFTALDYGRRCGLPVPTQVHVLGIGIADALTFSEQPTASVAAAVPPAADAVLARIREIAAGA